MVEERVVEEEVGYGHSLLFTEGQKSQSPTMMMLDPTLVDAVGSWLDFLQFGKRRIVKCVLSSPSCLFLVYQIAAHQRR